MPFNPRFQKPYGGGGARGGGVGGLIGPRAPSVPSRTPVGSYGNTVMDAARAPLAYEPNMAAAGLSMLGDLISRSKQRKKEVRAKDEARYADWTSKIQQGLVDLVDEKEWIKLGKKLNPDMPWDSESIGDVLKAQLASKPPADLTDLPKDAPGHLMSTRSAGFPGEARHNQMVGLVPQGAGPGQQQQGPPPQGPQQSRKGPLGGILSGMKDVGRFLIDPFKPTYSKEARSPVDPDSPEAMRHSRLWEKGQASSELRDLEDTARRADLKFGIETAAMGVKKLNILKTFLDDPSDKNRKLANDIDLVKRGQMDEFFALAKGAGIDDDAAAEAAYNIANSAARLYQLDRDKLTLKEKVDIGDLALKYAELFVNTRMAFDYATLMFWGKEKEAEKFLARWEVRKSKNQAEIEAEGSRARDRDRRYLVADKQQKLNQSTFDYNKKMGWAKFYNDATKVMIEHWGDRYTDAYDAYQKADNKADKKFAADRMIDMLYKSTGLTMKVNTEEGLQDRPFGEIGLTIKYGTEWMFFEGSPYVTYSMGALQEMADKNPDRFAAITGGILKQHEDSESMWEGFLRESRNRSTNRGYPTTGARSGGAAFGVGARMAEQPGSSSGSYPPPNIYDDLLVGGR